MVGFALATSGVADDKAEIERLKKEIEALKAKQELIQLRQELEELKNGRTANRDQTERKRGITYLKGDTKPFTGTSIGYYEDGSKFVETPYLNGKIHGTEIRYNRDGSKWLEIVWENGKKISEKEF